MSGKQLSLGSPLMDLAFESMDVGVVLFERPGDDGGGTRIIEVNAAFRRISGLDADDLQALLDLQNEDIRHFRSLCELLETDEALRAERFERRPDGRDLWMEVSVFLHEDPESRTRRGVAFIRDTTERKRNDEMLLLMERAIRSSSNGIVITDCRQDDNPIVYVNPAFEQITGYAAWEAFGRNCRFLQGDLSGQAEIGTLRDAIGSRQEARVLLRNMRKDGTIFWNELYISPVRNESGDVTHFIGILRDITERRRLEAQMLQSEKLASLGEMVAGVAHELNNPLASISTASQLLEMHEDQQVREDASMIRAATDRATRIVRALLTFARRDESARVISDINTTVIAVVDICRYRMSKAGILLDVDLAPDLPRIPINVGQVEQVLLNLVSNAEHALCSMPKNERRLTISTRRNSSGVVISVGDNGPGMAPATQRRVFDPFFTTKPVGEGTGLGLSISFGIARAHGGTLSVQSAPGSGAVFSLTLPVVSPS